MHTPYEEKLKHKADFRVKYRFYNPEEGGRMTGAPYQGYRSDFWYPHKDNEENKIFMISPEFEDEEKNVILTNDKPIKESGIARMWIINSIYRKYHQERIKVGTRGYFMEGPTKVAECEVVELIGLFENPIE